jgi:hypothetical protein
VVPQIVEGNEFLAWDGYEFAELILYKLGDVCGVH